MFYFFHNHIIFKFVQLLVKTCLLKFEAYTAGFFKFKHTFHTKLKKYKNECMCASYMLHIVYEYYRNILFYCILWGGED